MHGFINLSYVLFIIFLLLAFFGGVCLNAIAYECKICIDKRKRILPAYSVDIINPISKYRK